MATYYVDPAAGGANNGTSWTDAWTTIVTPMEAALNPGDIVYCRGSETLADFAVPGASGSAAGGHISFIGCNASGTNDGTRYLISGGGSIVRWIVGTSGRNFLLFANMEVSGTTSSPIFFSTSNDYWVLENVVVTSTSTWCIEQGNQNNNWTVSRCQFSGGSSGNVDRVQCYAYYSKFSDSVYGIYSMSAGATIGCIFENQSTAGMHYASWPLMCKNNVFHNCGTGLVIADGSSGAAMMIEGCRFTNCTTGVSQTNNLDVFINCYFQGCTTNISATSYYVPPIGGVTSHLVLDGTDSDYGYTDSTAGDYNLGATATGFNFAIETDGT